MSGKPADQGNRTQTRGQRHGGAVELDGDLANTRTVTSTSSIDIAISELLIWALLPRRRARVPDKGFRLTGTQSFEHTTGDDSNVIIWQTF